MRILEPRRGPRIVAALCGLLLCTFTAPRVEGHGLHGHIHVTGWAIENMPPGELRSIFDDPDVFQAALTGAMFPDTGYAPGRDDRASREYGEYAHWEPFIERFIEYVRTVHGPPYDTKEKQMLVAFLLGCAAHGLQDELFDSTFLYEVEQRDGAGQDIADPGTDGFLVLDGYFRMLPGEYLPVEEVLPLFSEDILGVSVDEQLIRDQVRAVRSAYVNETLGTRVAAGFGQRARTQIPWAADNYLDPRIAGSLGAEIVPTMRHMEALWERLHDRFDETNLVVHAWPDTPRRLRSAQAGDVASWVTLVFGKGIAQNRATGSFVDGVGAPHPFNLRYTRWGGMSRLVRFQPTADLAPGGTYTVAIEAGAELVDGSQTAFAHEVTFQVACEAEDDPLCPPIDEPADPTIRPADPTATATASPSPTAEPSATPTATASRTPTPTPTQTPTETATASWTPSMTPTVTATPTFSRTPTSTLPPTVAPTHTLTPTVPAEASPIPISDSGCAVRAPAERSSGWAWPLLLLPALAAGRLQRRRAR